MTNLEGITRNLIRKGNSKQEVIRKLLDLYKIHREASLHDLEILAEAIYEEVQKTEKIFHLLKKDFIHSQNNPINEILTPIKSNISMGEGGIGCRGEGDNFVHQLLAQLSYTSIVPYISPQSLDDTGAIQLTQDDKVETNKKPPSSSNFPKTIIVTKMEGMHSRLSDFPFLAGFHVTRALLRDIYVKGALPLSIMVDLHLADDGDIGKLFDFQAGIASIAEVCNVPITAGSTLRIGGDMVIGDRLTGGVAGIGILKYEFFRKNIQTGDKIIMTEGAGGGTISTTALYAGELETVKETLNIQFIRACQNLLEEERLCCEIHAMIDVTNGGLRNDLHEISLTQDIGFKIDSREVRQLINPIVRELLDVQSVDFLGVSLDSLVIFCNPQFSNQIIEFLNGNGILTHEIGEVISEKKLKIIDNTGETVVVPRFRESAYTKIKRMTNKLPEDSNLQKNKIRTAFNEAVKKKESMINYLGIINP